jgi:hypothetical protein
MVRNVFGAAWKEGVDAGIDMEALGLMASAALATVRVGATDTMGGDDDDT